MQNRNKTENEYVVIWNIVVRFSHIICWLYLVVSVEYSGDFSIVYFRLVILSRFVVVVLKDRKNIVRIVGSEQSTSTIQSLINTDQDQNLIFRVF